MTPRSAFVGSVVLSLLVPSGAPAAGNEGQVGGVPGLVAAYYRDPVNWNGRWPDESSQPTDDPARWTFTELAYSRVEPVINHLFVRRGWFSVRWSGLFDPTATDVDREATCEVTGCFRLNPAASERNAFEMELPDGRILTLRDLRGLAADYEGLATRVRFKPIALRDGEFKVDGFLYPLRPNAICEIRSGGMTVHLYNDNRNGKGRAMGEWTLSLQATNAMLDPCAETPAGPAKDAGRTGGAADCHFEILADDGCRLWIDGKPAIADWRACWEESPDAIRTAEPVRLADGPHQIVVEYFEGLSLLDDDKDPMKLFWSCPGRGVSRQVVAPHHFSHRPEDSIEPPLKKK